MAVNKVILVGRLGQDPELKSTPSGASVANFSVATNETWVDKSGQKQERTEWHRVVVWGKIAETCAKYLSKGRQVYIEGSLQTRSWDDQSGQKRYTTEVRAQTVQFLGGRSGEVSDSTGAESFSQAPAAAPMGPMAGGHSSPGGMSSSFTEEDIPF